ncbi:hypothetical protein [Rhodoferax sp.]|jgi:hypothetical protein|uniref:hypothetical protein n=1 Tax=Rhodoferax sp. TaxID=50421 RepID=UPI002727E7EC|nr:hypothetical protein [Rhodoferax sp.]MDO9196945.1 hypothetical protein [Rhodoferax sp.]
MKNIVIACLGVGLLVSGCGDQLTSEAQKAVEQIKLEASKAAAKTIDGFTIDTVAQLKKMQGVTEKKGKSEEKANKNGEGVVEK